MTKEKKNIPTIRFNNFTDAWEQRKLGELGKARSGIGFPDTEQGGKKGIPFFKVSDMNNAGNENEMLSANNYVTESQIARRRWKPISDIPAIFFAKVGAAVLLNRKRLCRVTFLLDNNTMAYSIDNKALNTNFAKTLFETIDLTSLIQVGVLPSYSSRNVENMDVIIPSILEQQKIGNYFHNLDYLITLHQRKFDHMKKLKTYFLQNLFPAKGEKVPKIRFKEFTGDWEQRNLGEVFKEFSDKNHSELPPLTIIQGEGTVLRDDSDRSSQYDRTSLPNYKMVNKGDFIVHLRSFEGGLEIATTQGIISPAYHTFHGEKIDPRFYYAFFRSEKFIKHDLFPYVYGIRDGKSIDIEGMKKIRIPFPPQEEQKRIGDFIDSLDSVLTLHQHQLDQLQSFKKFMLQNLFV